MIEGIISDVNFRVLLFFRKWEATEGHGMIKIHS